ncbi:MAG TPA: S8 family serine peptidase, partial [Candidatus Sulfomarinibacteraceae bacterium]|nr:S8 family serine peptidase [Candidatus Sulfomarinibacteraceae bacterium]
MFRNQSSRPTWPIKALARALFAAAVLMAPATTFALDLAGDSGSSSVPAGVPYIVTFASGTSSASQAASLAAVGATDLDSIPVLRMHAIELPADTADAGATALRADPTVVRVESDRERVAEATPSDTGYGSQWSLPKIAWDDAFGTVAPSGSATVAILDTGIDASHPDLAGQVLAGTSILDDSNGMTDPNGHGTWMAGIVAAATDNGEGIAGVAYAGVQVMPVTVLGADGTGLDSDIIEGVVYAADHGATVILMAFSNPGYSASLQAAIDYAWSSGAVLVAATGNDGLSTVAYPAGDRGVVGVSATDSSDSLWVGSNYGTATFIAAPGASIDTTALGGGYTAITGTSAAAAEVAAAAALAKAVDPTASNGVIVGRLGESADAVGTADQTGNGRLNLARAISSTSTTSVVPLGAPGGGPFVGPYVATATVNGATIVIQESTCTTNQTSFVVNATVCAEATISVGSGGGTPELRFQWYNSATPSSGALVSDTLYSPVVNNQVISETVQVTTTGTWTVLVCKTGNSGLCSPGNRQGTTTFTVTGNTAPTVSAGGPYSGNEGSAIALNGGSASDPDGPTPLTSAWTIDSQ